MNDRPKRHHHIAETIQRNFADARGQLYFWRRGEFPPERVMKAAPGKLFVQKELYTMTEADGTKTTELEGLLADLDSHCADFLRQIQGALDQRKVPNLSTSAWEFWFYFLYYHIKRSPAYMDKVTEHYSHRNFVLNEERLEGREPTVTELDRLTKNYRVAAQSVPPSPEVFDALTSKGLVIIIPAGLQRSYILGDAGIAQARAVAGERAFSGMTPFLPVAPHIALGQFGHIVLACEFHEHPELARPAVDSAEGLAGALGP